MRLIGAKIILEYIHQLLQTIFGIQFLADLNNVHFQPLAYMINFRQPAEQVDPQPWRLDAVDEHLHNDVVVVGLLLPFEGVYEHVEHVDDRVEGVFAGQGVGVVEQVYQGWDHAK